MKPEKVYAKALFQTASLHQATEKTSQELAAVCDLYGQSPFLVRLWKATFVKAHVLIESTRLVGESLGLSPLTTRFLTLVATRRRLSDLPRIDKAYRDLLWDSQGVVPVTIRFAHPPTFEQKKALESTLAHLFKRTPHATYLTDARLLGGLTVTAGCFLWDGSWRTALGRYRQTLMALPAPSLLETKTPTEKN